MGRQAWICTTATYKLPVNSFRYKWNRFSWDEIISLAAHLAETGYGHAPTLPDVTGFSEAQKYDLYSAYIKNNGSDDAKCALDNGDQVILGLRIPTNTRVNQGQGKYDDRIALIWQEKPKAPVAMPVLVQGRQFGVPIPAAVLPPAPPFKHALDFIANTEPSAQYEERPKQVVRNGKVLAVPEDVDIIDPNGKKVLFRKIEGEDVNRDGRADLARLVPGTYKFHFGGYSQPLKSNVLRGDDQQVVQRDINHDGEFTVDDMWQSDKGQTFVQKGNFAILIHPGSSSNTDSAGCQTIPRTQFNRFFNTLRAEQKHFYYVLVSMK